MSMPAPVVTMRGITKAFGSFVANADVDLTLSPGSIHAVLGENGAGKTTLMRMLYGMIQPDQGTITIDGEAVRLGSPAHAIKRGIGMVHQHFMIAPSLSVAENIVLGSAPTRRGLLDTRAARQRVAEVADRTGLRLDPAARAGDLSVGMLQRVEIVKALYRGARVLILDEPTAVLSPREAVELGAALRNLAAQGTSVIFITHKLTEVTNTCDVATVLRRGRVVGEVMVAETGHRELTELMIGRQVRPVTPSGRPVPGENVLRVDGLSVKDDRGREAVREVSFCVPRGTIVGVAGVEGNGQSELVEAIAGLRRPSAGRYYLDGVDSTRYRPRRLRQRRLAHIPEDRLARGVAGTCSITDNLSLTVYRRRPYSRFGLLSAGRIRDYATELIDRFGVACSCPEQPVGSLSGGNMQKVVIARELAENPVLVLAAQPTRGVDIGAIEFIHGALTSLRDGGTGVLLVSAELDELLALCDTIHVMYEGRIVLTVPADEATDVAIGAAMAGSTSGGSAKGGDER
jgi:simple sugar transport system ATP-binding protein